jgi:hypothetical protein
MFPVIPSEGRRMGKTTRNILLVLASVLLTCILLIWIFKCKGMGNVKDTPTQ